VTSHARTSGCHRWYVDELAFTPQDATGRTIDDLRELHFRRDRAYLQS
jgi:hypothetical protein